MAFSMPAFAQDISELKTGEKYEIKDDDYTNKDVDMADKMRENGKIYVVVGVITIIFIGITAYAISIDRKLSKIEKEVFKEKVNS
ncbi:hypothetical protein BFP71_03825 [Roseivirga misakiensis]|uniref:CcmD family protein n=1 Tax=Roseivirga misakiensis TaxID=1563681 RepID=A0A1E5T794_9BACT|nr:hypothetical protein BFP71_03825 [Roseivirga misakiensis]